MIQTIFSSGVIHFRCSSEYLWHQNSVFWIESNITTVCVLDNEGTCHSLKQLRLIEVFVIVFGKQWSHIEWRKKIQLINLGYKRSTINIVGSTLLLVIFSRNLLMQTALSTDITEVLKRIQSIQGRSLQGADPDYSGIPDHFLMFHPSHHYGQFMQVE